MAESADTNAAIWQSKDVVGSWAADADARERLRASHRDFMAALLPFAEQDRFTFLDLGAGTGAASAAILARFPQARATLADFSQPMMAEGERQLAAFGQRFRYVEFDLTLGKWPAALAGPFDAVVTSLCVHHLPDERKQTLFAEIYAHLAPGAWYLNYDPVTSTDSVVEETWQRVNDRFDPEAAVKRAHRTPLEQARYENHVRYMIPLEGQVEYLRTAGFEGVDVYWKQLENVIYGGRRPLRMD
jgi:tRNA (cmo5U34)-methyltransferase